MSAAIQAFETQSAALGTEIGLSSWITLDQATINTFADITRDRQFIHIDPARAKAETPFGGSIAHGFLTLSQVSSFLEECITPHYGTGMSINYGFDKVRFLSPVPSGARLRGRFVLQEVTLKSDDSLLEKFGVTIEIEDHDKPALIAQWLTLTNFIN